MLYLVCVVVGIIVGVVGALVWTKGHRGEGPALLEVQLANAEEALARERNERVQERANFEQLFESTAQRVFTGALGQFSALQGQIASERDSKLSLSLRPLEGMLEAYRTQIENYGREQSSALNDVRQRADAMLEAQRLGREETKRLNALLGRGDQRGHWGEVQMVNVLNASGLVRGIDFDTQVSVANSEGRLLRPDGVVYVGDAKIALDAKFPFDAFEAGQGSDDEAQRRAHYATHASALRSHVKALSEKSYWEAMEWSPEFVICFIPSDMALSVALDADPGLHAYAATSRVLLAGPTNLLALLWSVALVVGDQRAAQNAREILSAAESVVDRLRTMIEPIVKMGSALRDSVSSYNQMVRSVESRLIPATDRLKRLGVGKTGREMPKVVEIDEHVTTLHEERWGGGGLFDALETSAHDSDSDIIGE